MTMTRTEFTFLILVTQVCVGNLAEAGNPKNQNQFRPCETLTLLPTLKISLSRLIPEFDPDNLALELDGGEKIHPSDPNFSDFLIRYYKTGKSGLSRCKIQDERLRNPILMTFNDLYLRFLTQYGVRLSCISYYSGASEFSSVKKVDGLVSNLRKRLRIGDEEFTNNEFPPVWNPPTNQGRQLVRTLRIKSAPFSDVTIGNSGFRSPVCNEMFARLQDGKTLTVLPIYENPPFQITIPGDKAGTDIVNSWNATNRLSRYMSTGLKCLDSNYMRRNFSILTSDWISNELIPELLETSHCVKEFPGILILMQSIEKYGNLLKVNYEIPPQQSQLRQEQDPLQQLPPLVVFLPFVDSPNQNQERNSELNTNFDNQNKLPTNPVNFQGNAAPFQQVPEVQYFQLLPPQQPPSPPPIQMPPERIFRFRDFEPPPEPPQTFPPPPNQDDEEFFQYSPDFQSQPLIRPKPIFMHESTEGKSNHHSHENEVVVSTSALTSAILLFIILIVFCCGLLYFCCSEEINPYDIKERFRQLFRPFRRYPPPPDFNANYEPLIGVQNIPPPPMPPVYTREPISKPIIKNTKGRPKSPKSNRHTEKHVTIQVQNTGQRFDLRLTEDEEDDDEEVEEGDDDSENEEIYKSFPDDLQIVLTPQPKLKSNQSHPLYSTSSLTPSSESLSLSEDDGEQIIFERYADTPQTDLTPEGKQNLRRLHRQRFNSAATAATVKYQPQPRIRSKTTRNDRKTASGKSSRKNYLTATDTESTPNPNRNSVDTAPTIFREKRLRRNTPYPTTKRIFEEGRSQSQGHKGWPTAKRVLEKGKSQSQDQNQERYNSEQNHRRGSADSKNSKTSGDRSKRNSMDVNYMDSENREKYSIEQELPMVKNNSSSASRRNSIPKETQHRERKLSESEEYFENKMRKWR